MSDSNSPPRDDAGASLQDSRDNRNWQYVYLGITGAFEPDEVTDFLGLAPTKVRARQDGRTDSSRKFAIWNFGLPLGDDVAIEDQLKLLLSLILPKLDLIKILAAKHEVRVQIVGDFGCEGYPGLFFDTEIIKCLGELGLAVDFDLYGWQEPPEVAFNHADLPS